MPNELSDRSLWTVRDYRQRVDLPSAEEMLALEGSIPVPEGRKGLIVLWRSQPCLVVSQLDSRLPTFHLAQLQLQKEGWPISMRRSGGSAFPQGPGILNVTVITEADNEFAGTIEEGYRWFCGRCEQGLSELGIESTTASVEGSFCDGRYNLTVAGKKLAGTSQRWSRRDGKVRKLFHCGLLMDIDKQAVCTAVNHFYLQAGRDDSNADVVPDVIVNMRELIDEQAMSSVGDVLIKALSAE